MSEKMYEICEPHGRIRCGECRYIEELKERIERYERALKQIIYFVPMEGLCTDIATVIAFQKIARQALEGEKYD